MDLVADPLSNLALRGLDRVQQDLGIERLL